MTQPIYFHHVICTSPVIELQYVYWSIDTEYLELYTAKDIINKISKSNIDIRILRYYLRNRNYSHISYMKGSYMIVINKDQCRIVPGKL